MKKSYRFKTWIDPRVQVRQSRVSAKGLFATAPIKKDEPVVVFGGVVFSTADVEAGKAKKRSLLMVGEDLWLGERPEDPDQVDWFLNHSCDPNLWFQDEVTLIARRDIVAWEEVTLDYAMHFGDAKWTMKERCRCGSPNCRGVITGRDWMLEDLQKRYSGHFSPFLNGRIVRLRQERTRGYS